MARLDHATMPGRSHCGGMTRDLTDGIRIAYLEDDPVLRELLAKLLREHARVEEVTTYATPKELLDEALPSDIDVALLDLALGDGRTSGVEVGIALRGMRLDLPVVILSQYSVDDVADVLPARHRFAWLFLEKSGQFDVEELVASLEATIRGASEVVVAEGKRPQLSVLGRLTPRQREIMALATTGRDARVIAERLFLAHVTVRSELSRAYRVLVPDAGPGTDLRTAAVLEYLRLTSHNTQLPPHPPSEV